MHFIVFVKMNTMFTFIDFNSLNLLLFLGHTRKMTSSVRQPGFVKDMPLDHIKLIFSFSSTEVLNI